MRLILGSYFALIIVSISFFVAIGNKAAYGDEQPYKAEIEVIDKQIEKSVKYLISRINADGSIGNKDEPNIGITGLIISAISRTKWKETYLSQLQGSIDYILKNESSENFSYGGEYAKISNYFTSIAIIALTSMDKEKYKKYIERSTNYLKGTQVSEDIGYKKTDWQYGGFGYDKSANNAPDLMNTGYALLALHSANVKQDDKVWERSKVFLQRVHNSSEVSDLEKVKEGVKVTNDGGGMYFPGDTKGVVITNEDGTKSFSSYGSMTYQLMQSYLFAGVSKDDVRIKEIMRYITTNFTLETNPGLPEKSAKEGLFNYYRVMAEALNELGEKKIETSRGKVVVWAKELSLHLDKLQDKDGTWKNNDSSRWLEGNPDIVTAYGVMALAACRDNLLK